MALSHTNTLKAAATDAVTALLRNVTLPGDGTELRLLDASNVQLVALLFEASGEDPGEDPFGAANGTTGIADANTIENGVVTDAGTATKFRIFNTEGSAYIEGTVGTSGADINLNNNVLVVDQIVQITSLTYRALPA